MRLVILALAAVLASCGVRDVAYNPSKFRVSGPIVPPDIIMPAGARAGTVVRGLHIGDAAGPVEDLCCWINDTASFSVRKQPHQEFLRVGAYVPETDAFKHTPQVLSVQFSSGEVVVLPSFGPGMHAATVRLPRDIAAAKGPLELRFRARSRYVPPDLPTSHFAALLVSVYFR